MKPIILTILTLSTIGCKPRQPIIEQQPIIQQSTKVSIIRDRQYEALMSMARVDHQWVVNNITYMITYLPNTSTLVLISEGNTIEIRNNETGLNRKEWYILEVGYDIYIGK